ncbi:hypothetical protein [Sinobaca qinghaiensis]|uniref:hypothetical protein n=1 Tax=Sinobaca qinghaiensis TaxID=342944 RepID=UPI001475EF71|nr:hypothetical protein [Sinobaca qinghaiensis]
MKEWSKKRRSSGAFFHPLFTDAICRLKEERKKARQTSGKCIRIRRWVEELWYNNN